MNLSGVILAGGQSRRMGRDKALVEVQGRSLLGRSLAILREVGLQEIFISGRAEADYSEFDCPVLLDENPGSGPVAGIERALDAARTPLLLVLAVDMPGMTATFLRKLSLACDLTTGVVPELLGQFEPLAAIYPRRCHAIARDCLASGHRAARRFAEMSLQAGAVRRFAVGPEDASCFINYNTPEDLSKPLS